MQGERPPPRGAKLDRAPRETNAREAIVRRKEVFRMGRAEALSTFNEPEIKRKAQSVYESAEGE